MVTNIFWWSVIFTHLGTEFHTVAIDCVLLDNAFIVGTVFCLYRCEKMIGWLLILFTEKAVIVFLYLCFSKLEQKAIIVLYVLTFFHMRQTNAHFRYEYFWDVMLHHWMFDS
jgi:hypothetical protein